MTDGKVRKTGNMDKTYFHMGSAKILVMNISKIFLHIFMCVYMDSDAGVGR